MPTRTRTHARTTHLVAVLFSKTVFQALPELVLDVLLIQLSRAHCGVRTTERSRRWEGGCLRVHPQRLHPWLLRVRHFPSHARTPHARARARGPRSGPPSGRTCARTRLAPSRCTPARRRGHTAGARSGQQGFFACARWRARGGARVVAGGPAESREPGAPEAEDARQG